MDKARKAGWGRDVRSSSSKDSGGSSSNSNSSSDVETHTHKPDKCIHSNSDVKGFRSFGSNAPFPWALLRPAPLYSACFAAVSSTCFTGPILAFLVPAQQQVPFGFNRAKM
ncbi:hypothetical protein AMECASPLE_035491 [Ameca splendens]|uniref:Uncharacterized protein n=1 Tax=Ameca splendens TaxID=208324 RepID=A0ABV0XKE1_9TELE